MPMNRKAGLFGLTMHAAILAVFVLLRTIKGERFGPELLFAGMPLLLLSSYIVYHVVVARYLNRRAGMQRAVIIDSLVGMLVEYIIFTLAAVLFGVYEGLRTGGGGMLTAVYRNILWAYATFMIHILVLGNLCGLAGWFVLKRTKTAQ